MEKDKRKKGEKPSEGRLELPKVKQGDKTTIMGLIPKDKKSTSKWNFFKSF